MYRSTLHYTAFGFYEQSGALKQRWAIHIYEDGLSSWVPSRRRCIARSDITRLSVRNFLTLSRCTLFIFFFQG